VPPPTPATNLFLDGLGLIVVVRSVELLRDEDPSDDARDVERDEDGLFIEELPPLLRSVGRDDVDRFDAAAECVESVANTIVVCCS